MVILLLYNLVGVIVGLVMGAMPGLTVTMTAALVVSLTFGWPMVEALSFIIGAFCGGVLGGAISAITINIPGTAAAVATTFDGFPLKQKGEADTALGFALFSSLIGGLFGVLFFVILGPIIGAYALRFGAQEYFVLTVWGLTLVAVLSKGNIRKGLISAVIGIFIGMIGMDPITGLMRFTMAIPLFSGGIHYVVAMIGLFGMKEVFVQLTSKKSGFKLDIEGYKMSKLLPRFDLLKKLNIRWLISAPIGAIIGLLPGTGGDVGALVSYGFLKNIIKKPSRPFGEGAYEGVIAPEVANKAAVGGALTTMLTLGIPGDSVTAVILGAFYLHGLLPGPTFMLTERSYFYLIAIFVIAGMIFSYFIGIVGSNAMIKMLNLPKWYLIAFIPVLCIVGSFALQNKLTDVLFMFIFGLIGYFFEKSGYPVSPMILGIILGPMVEINFRQALIITGSFPSLIISFFTRPISLILVILVAISLLLQSRLEQLE
ncbi:MAG: tripartite tricarboxylate transporter permease [Atribacterota bacterium]|nr:tripartite tricarboxylate transporter permease [Atribacterota bacterium]MDD5636570.1 tripartite tricarboxylate transporter permease [Atribacterota bacterium]